MIQSLNELNESIHKMLLAEAVSEAPSYITTLLWLAPLPLFLSFALIALGFNKVRPLTPKFRTV